MAKMFRMLLMAAQTGIRWLLGMFRINEAGMKADIATAPGTPMEASLKSTFAEMKTAAVNAPGSDMTSNAKTGQIRIMANIISQLVVDAVFRGKIKTSGISASADNAPENPMEFRGQTETVIAAIPETADEAPCQAAAHTELMDMASSPGNGQPAITQIYADVPQAAFFAQMANSAATEATATQTLNSAGVFAKMTLWREPAHEGTILKITQVHHAVQDGNTLKIY